MSDPDGSSMLIRGDARRAWPTRWALLASAIGLALLAAGAGKPAVVPAELFVSPQGSDDGVCARTRPCLSFRRAYAVAKPGQTVEVAAGTYVAQTIEPDGAKASGDRVTFRPAAGGTATVADVDIRGASNITFAGSGIGTGFVFGWWNARIGTRNVSFERMNTGGFDITSASNISIIGGQVGPQHSGYDPQINSGDDASNPTNIVIDGVLFRDIQRATSADHTECLQIGAGINIVIKNSIFVQCSDHDLYFHPWHPVPGGQLSNVTIENNFFAKTSIGFYNGQFARGYANCTNFTLKNNVMEQGWVFDCPSSNGAADPSVSNNYWIGDAPPGCGAVGTWRANIFDTAPQRPCDSAQKIVKTATQMGLKGSDARRGLTKVRFLCGSQAEGALVSVAACQLRAKQVTYRALLVAAASGKLRFLKTTADRRSASTPLPPEILTQVALVGVGGNAKLQSRVEAFVEKWLGRGRPADGRFGTTRVRLYGDGLTWTLLLSPA